MSLEPGTRVGSYEVIALAGAGGMGRVFRARDTKLHRDVALKVLPDSLSADPERLARFHREARTLASLDHPNIAHIHAVEDFQDVTVLVMEFVEGDDLAEWLERGPIPFEDAMPIARQIVAALEAAHERGVVHRDLKPANIKIRPDGTVKVLDFGLAKPMEATDQGADVSRSPTITSPAMTRAGVLLGTAAYMAPEQARGRAVDKRADIWAFGCVLFEMLTGTRAFPGTDLSETIAAVLKDEPDYRLLNGKCPANVAAVVRRCLQREVRQRARDIGDVGMALDGAFSPSTSEGVQGPANSRRLGWLIGVAALVALGAIVGFFVRRPVAASAPRVHLALNLPTTDHLVAESNINGVGATMALSPDGGTLVYTARRDGVQQMYRRRGSFEEADPVVVPGTIDSEVPFFSPDGRWLGFVTNRTIKKMLLPDGVPVIVQNWNSRITHAQWTVDGQIVFGTNIANDFIYQVSANGGTAQPLTAAGHRNGTIDRRPELLPDQRGFLFQRSTDVYVHPASGQEKAVVTNATWARALPTGHLLFWRGATVFAARFSLDTLAVAGDPVPVLGGVSAPPSVSDNGTLVYQTGSASAGHTFAWVDRAGRAEALSLAACRCTDPALSPDGRRLAVVQNGDIFVHDIGRGGRTQLTVNAATGHPAWSPDRTHVGFTLGRPGKPTAFAWRAVDGSGPVEELVTNTDAVFEGTWAPDGRTILVAPVSPTTSGDIVSVSGRGAAPRPLIQSPRFDLAPRVSPNGRWLAYSSLESGLAEIYVRPFPNVNDGSWKVSVDGGRDPRWSAKGDELYYTEKRAMYRTSVVTEGTAFTFSAPEVLFKGDYIWSDGRHSYDVAPDGRFLMMKDVPGNVTLQVVLNWMDELKGKVP